MNKIEKQKKFIAKKSVSGIIKCELCQEGNVQERNVDMNQEIGLLVISNTPTRIIHCAS